ncbi:MAG: AMP-binding protein [Rhodobacter sp.]|nr:AMP-binding protein [Rhodobacter sp.]
MHDGSAHHTPTLIGSRLEELALRHGDLPALDDLFRAPLDYSALTRRIRDIRSMVAAAGIAAGARVALWMANRADAAIWLTALGESCECLPLVPTMPSGSVLQAFRALSPVALITDGSDGDTCRAAIAETGTPRLVVTAKPKSWDWTLAGRLGPPAPDHPAASANAVAYYLMTSGSTGVPKIVPVCHQAIALTTGRAADGLALRPGEAALNIMQLNHVHGLMSGVFLPWMGAGCTVMPGEYSAERFLDWYDRARPAWFSTSPAIFRDILRRAAASGQELGHEGLRFVRCGSAALDPALRADIERAFAVPVLNAYGMSEALQIAGVPAGRGPRNSVGLPLADEVGIFDGDTRLAQAGAQGEIRIRGRTVMPHYAGDPGRGQGFRDGWFETGDIGHLDVDGFLFVAGRLGDRINLGGEMLDPALIEAALQALDGIEECVCFGVPHDLLGEALSAAVVLAPSAVLDAEAVRRAARNVLPASQVPGQVHLVDAIPRDRNGKINRKEIANSFARPDVGDLARQGAGDTGPAPDGAIETWLFDSFRRILRNDALDVNSDFFDQGGTSLDMMELLLEIEEKLGETIHLPALFNAPSVRRLAAFLARQYPAEVARITQRAPHVAPGGQAGPSQDLWASFRASLPGFKGPPLAQSSASPVFILSAPRCGSTLLRVMLAGHGQVFAPPEMRLLGFHSVDQWAARHDGAFRLFRDGLVQAVMSATDCDEAGARDWLAHAETDRRPVEHVYDHLQRNLGSRLIVDKTPHYALSAAVLKSIRNRFAAPRFLVLHRNPYEMKRSFIKARMDQLWMYGGGIDPGALAEMIWTESYSNIKAFTETLDPRRVTHLHFEDLVTDPGDTMARVCRFLRLPFDPAMLDPYADPDRRMTAGLAMGSKMIGDPQFLRHRAIDPARAGSGFTFPDRNGLAAETQALAGRNGYAREGDARPEPRALAYQRNMVRTWGGQSEALDDFVFAFNRQAPGTPILWVSQQEHEAAELSAALGPLQPLYYMRSGHLLVGRHDRGIDELAENYVRSIETRYPDGPIILGGNCQGADVARAMCRIFLARKREVALLVVVDADFTAPLDVAVAHIFGSESHRNPFLNGRDPRPAWNTQYPEHSVDFLPCKHGYYFRGETLAILAGHLNRRIAAALQRR